MIGSLNLEDFNKLVPKIALQSVGMHSQPSNTGSETNWTPQPISRTYDWMYKFRYSIPSGSLNVNGTTIDITNTVIVGFGYVLANSRRQWCEIGVCLYSTSTVINNKTMFRKDYGGGTNPSTNIGWKTL